MSTHTIQFHDKIRKFLLICVFLSYRKNFVGTRKCSNKPWLKRAIGVQAIEVRLYWHILTLYQISLNISTNQFSYLWCVSRTAGWVTNNVYILRSLVRIYTITKTRLFKYIENFTSKNWKFSDKKKLWYFSYFCSKHRLWVLVRTASARRF